MVTGTYLRLILGKATSAVEQFDRLSIDGTGLHITDFMILEALLNKGSMNISTVGEKVLLTSGSMTAAANRLKKKDSLSEFETRSMGAAIIFISPKRD